jgi:lipoate-protein ligase A
MVSPAAEGARAMALDEALLEACAVAPAAFVPVLRFYAFAPACLSLGRFQRGADVDRDACRRLGIAVVRRPTGGRAVLHDRCLTYALVAPADAAPFSGGIRASAERIGAALVAGLGGLGVTLGAAPLSPHGSRPADCFAIAAAGEVIAAGRKLAGSAQLRRGGGVLQHGTVRLRAGAGRAASVLRDGPSMAQDGGATSLEDLCGRPVTFSETTTALAAGLAASFGVRLRGVAPDGALLRRAAELERTRYRADGWTWSR